LIADNLDLQHPQYADHDNTVALLRFGCFIRYTHTRDRNTFSNFEQLQLGNFSEFLSAHHGPLIPSPFSPTGKKGNSFGQGDDHSFFLRGRREQSTKETRLAEKSTFLGAGRLTPCR
ncbi:MAG: hypothetical protein ACKOBW_04250, partial [Planctomycetota bacterium]